VRRRSLWACSTPHDAMAMLALALFIVAVTVAVVCAVVVVALRRHRRDGQLLALVAMFGPVAERARHDPRVLLTWYPTAEGLRQAFPDAFDVLGQGQGGYPFSPADLEAAHAKWTADWLDWERSHDAEYREKSLVLETSLQQATDEMATALSARVSAMEREKLGEYQRRYEEYVKVSRALADLSGGTIVGGRSER